MSFVVLVDIWKECAASVLVIWDSWRKSDHTQFWEGEKYRVSIEPMDSISRRALLSAKSMECGGGQM